MTIIPSVMAKFHTVDDKEPPCDILFHIEIASGSR